MHKRIIVILCALLTCIISYFCLANQGYDEDWILGKTRKETSGKTKEQIVERYGDFDFVDTLNQEYEGWSVGYYSLDNSNSDYGKYAKIVFDDKDQAISFSRVYEKLEYTH